MDASLARVMADLITGIYVLTVAEGGLHHGMSSSWVTQVSGNPPLIMATVDNGHRTRAMIERRGALGLNLVGRRNRALEDYFLSARARRPDNLAEFDYELSPQLKVPWLRVAMASLEARLVESRPAGDHSLMIAAPVSVRLNQRDRPLTSLDLDYVYLGGSEVIARDRSGWS